MLGAEGGCAQVDGLVKRPLSLTKLLLCQLQSALFTQPTVFTKQVRDHNSATMYEKVDCRFTLCNTVNLTISSGLLGRELVIPRLATLMTLDVKHSRDTER